MSKDLNMCFRNEEGKKVSINVNTIKEDLTESEVSEVMDLIIVKNLFQSSGGDLKMKESAQIIEKSVEELNIN